jgi:hypothetical protein
VRLFDVLQVLDAEVAPTSCKIHLAVWNGKQDPLDEYLAGRFDEWQEWQTKRNFARPHVLSLIQLPGRHQWLFAGLHDANGCSPPNARGLVRYRMERRPHANALDGRLVVNFERPGRQSYLRAERWLDALQVAEIRPQRMVVAEFPGYSATMLTKRHLDIVVAQAVDSWRSALLNVAGVYLIADRHSGKLYVGSATGDGGIWARWCAYSKTGHGGNAELRVLLREKGANYADNFQFGVLEIAGTHADEGDVLIRESYWKDLLLTRTHGLNAN